MIFISLRESVQKLIANNSGESKNTRLVPICNHAYSMSATKTTKARQIVEVKKVLLKTSKRLKSNLNNGEFKLCK
jgi:hypothetical protein